MNFLKKIFNLTPKKYAWVREEIDRLYPFDTVVFTNGCFDLFHPGHLSVLELARKIADKDGVVVVGINSDESVRRLKGPGRPIFSDVERVRLLRSIEIVDIVVPFDEDTPLDLITAVQPTFILKGADYRSDQVVGRDVADVLLAPYDESWSTSKLISRIKLL